MIYVEPVRAGVEASGMSEEEVNQIFSTKRSTRFEVSERLSVVFDTQIFLRALINRNSVCGRIGGASFRQHYLLFVSDAIEAEVS